jgi:type I restriction-modification system DNA methylase subunit
MPASSDLNAITDFQSLVAYLRDELEWEIPEGLSYDKLTYNYTADELGLQLDAQVEITQLRPILGQKDPWGVFFVDFDKTELPVTLLRRILSAVSRKNRASANAADRALFEKNDLLFISAFGKADDRRLALAHFHQEPETSALPTLRVLTWDRQDTARHMSTAAERLERLRWPDERELPEAWKSRWGAAFVDRPREAIRTSKEMAMALADCAKQIRQAIQEILPKEKKGQPLTQIFEAVKATLSKDLDVPKFADTYAQTISYGLLSKRIDQVQQWRAEKARALDGTLALPPITVDALETAIPTNPFLSELLSSFMAAVGRNAGGAGLDFDELGLGDLVDLLNRANIVAVLDDFDKDKQGDDPVIHFYEQFFEEYDPETRFERGVFYTPKPVVSFIVRSVDAVLRGELGLPLGLADTTTWGQYVAAHPGTVIPDGALAEDAFVKILDPATGTGTFPVEVIDLVHRRMMDEAWKGETFDEKRRLWNAYVPQHLLPRLCGFELMMAPYAVAHMKIGLKLADTGYDFSGVEIGADGNERPTRARIFLTNALEPARRFALDLNWSAALANEAEAGNRAKEESFTVVIGNPPYKGNSANPSRVKGKLTAAGELVQRYFRVDGQPLGEKTAKWINNDYIKFIALGEMLTERSGVAVMGYITSNSWLDGLIFRGVRASLIESMNRLWIVDLHGNINRRERCPDGSPDDGVFKILEGTNITIGARSPALSREVRQIDVQGEWSENLPSRGKRLWIESHTLDTADTRSIKPSPPLRLLTRAIDTTHAAPPWPSIKEVMLLSGVGMTTARDHFAIDFDRAELLSRVEAFRDSVSPIGAALKQFSITDKDGWDGEVARTRIRASGDLNRLLVPIAFSPLDVRWTMYSDAVIWRTARPVMEPMIDGNNVAFVTTRQTKDRWGILATSHPIRHKAVSAYDISSIFPLYQFDAGVPRSNLSPLLTARLAKLTGLRLDEGPDASTGRTLRERGDLKATFGARDAFDWIYAVLHSPTYRERYADLLKSDFARVPLPSNGALFAALIPLGARLVALHLLDAEVLPDLLGDPKVRFVSNGGVARLGRLGDDKEVRRDVSGRVYLNAKNWFTTVPQVAWDHWIGGYQPAQKWLKDRSQTGSGAKLKTGRLLTDDDILHYRRMVVALEETPKVMAEIDKVIDAHGGWPGAFAGMTD